MLALIVTCYQSERELASFFSWLAPVVHKFSKIVIVDDASTDGTSTLLRGYSSSLSQLEVVFRTENSGRPSLPRNDGLALVTEEDRVVFLDIDDRLPYSYLEFLNDDKTDNCFSGVKFVCDPKSFDAWSQVPSFRYREVFPRSLHFKNQIVFSGASLPARIAKRHSFLNQPLEDWLYWKSVAARENVRFIRLLDVPIAYSAALSLSPRKARQVKRVYGHVHSGVIRYFASTLRLKWEEYRLRGLFKRG